MHSLNTSRKTAQKGYSLIEVLIGVLVLSIGILGMATMQVNAKRLGYDALQRNIALNLITEIIDRMRVNTIGVASGFYVVDNFGDSAPPAVDCYAPVECSSWDSATQKTNSANLAAFDFYEWYQSMMGATEVSADGVSVGGLVSPRACITYTPTADEAGVVPPPERSLGGMVKVTLVWKGMQALGNPSQTNTCGTGLNLYGEGEEQRQMVVYETYIR